MTARREEVGTASRGNADEEEGRLFSALLISQTDSETPMDSVLAESLLRVVREELRRRQTNKHLQTEKYSDIQK